MNYRRPVSRIASLALLSAGLFVAGSFGSSAPASAAPNRIRQVVTIKQALQPIRQVASDSAWLFELVTSWLTRL